MRVNPALLLFALTVRLVVVGDVLAAATPHIIANSTSSASAAAVSARLAHAPMRLSRADPKAGRIPASLAQPYWAIRGTQTSP